MVLCSCPHRQYSGVDLTRRCNNIFLHASAGASGTLCSSPPASPGWADCAPGPAPASACLRPQSWGPASPTQPQCSPCSAQNECRVEVQSREGLPPCAPAGDRVTGGPGTPMMNKTEAPVYHLSCTIGVQAHTEVRGHHSRCFQDRKQPQSLAATDCLEVLAAAEEPQPPEAAGAPVCRMVDCCQALGARLNKTRHAHLSSGSAVCSSPAGRTRLPLLLEWARYL